MSAGMKAVAVVPGNAGGPGGHAPRADPGFPPPPQPDLRRDHQGTVWPWLIGPFVEAWIRVRGGTASARAEANERFLTPILRHTSEAGLGHISEVADGDAPHNPGGCPFQAWSVGEAIRLDRVVLAGRSARGGKVVEPAVLAEVPLANPARRSRPVIE